MTARRGRGGWRGRVGPHPQNGVFEPDLAEYASPLQARRLFGGHPDRLLLECVGQLQPVIWMTARRDVREAGAVKRGHQKVAGAAWSIAGEDPAGPVRAMGCRRLLFFLPLNLRPIIQMMMSRASNWMPTPFCAADPNLAAHAWTARS